LRNGDQYAEVQFFFQVMIGDTQQLTADPAPTPSISDASVSDDMLCLSSLPPAP
jgi:hypothetical protein